jgi:RNA ligase (TIGR02306 family)
MGFINNIIERVFSSNEEATPVPTNRKLASIQTIASLEVISGADTIEKAKVLGWDVVVKKGEFKVGDQCVYVEIDSILPDRPEFAFMQNHKMRVKTVRLRGQISQGICFPLSILPSIDGIAREVFADGTDVTEILGITKYEPVVPAHLAGKVKGSFPSFLPKTDETRVQNLQSLLDIYANEPCYVAEKLDGSSVTFYLKDDDFGVCSRNIDLKEEAGNSFWQAAKQLGIEGKLRWKGKNIALQGELVGEGIQGNKLKLKGKTVYFFSAFDIDNQKYFTSTEFFALINELGLQTVPVIDQSYRLRNDINELVKLSIRKSLLADVWAEGIVIRNIPGHHRDRISFKVINPEFLLKHGE